VGLMEATSLGRMALTARLLSGSASRANQITHETVEVNNY
jgi:hypothetical protein